MSDISASHRVYHSRTYLQSRDPPDRSRRARPSISAIMGTGYGQILKLAQKPIISVIMSSTAFCITGKANLACSAAKPLAAVLEGTKVAVAQVRIREPPVVWSCVCNGYIEGNCSRTAGFCIAHSYPLSVDAVPTIAHIKATKARIAAASAGLLSILPMRSRGTKRMTRMTSHEGADTEAGDPVKPDQSLSRCLCPYLHPGRTIQMSTNEIS